jgi:hypothetical protein
MQISMTRLILYVRDVARLKAFYQTHFGFRVTEEISDEWAVLLAGQIGVSVVSGWATMAKCATCVSAVKCQTRLHCRFGIGRFTKQAREGRCAGWPNKTLPRLRFFPLRRTRPRGQRLSAFRTGLNFASACRLG